MPLDLAPLDDRIARIIPPAEWQLFAPDIAAIQAYYQGAVGLRRDKFKIGADVPR